MSRVGDWTFCVAPLMDGTDRHCRFFHRLLSQHARLYSEMIVADAVVHGDREHLLVFDRAEHKVALQVGGSDPGLLAQAAKIGADFGYDEINLNVGCPSDRVQSGAFGACLMKTPGLVAECWGAMQAAVDIPVTVKSRIGVDEQDPEESLFGFVETLAGAGCRVFIVHARKAWLQGLSPKENRETPPLDYDLVRRLKAAKPALTVVLNGGIATIDEAASHLKNFDGVMLGRAAYGEPAILTAVDRLIFDIPAPDPDITDVARTMSGYVRQMAARGVSPHHVTRHMLGLMHGRPGARRWRQLLSARGASTPVSVIDEALAELETMAVLVG
ncbi:MAG: tRNA dihydrouridine(20/20a) synthase DusA [Parvularculaceae bacterium]